MNESKRQDTIVLMMVSGMSTSDIEAACCNQMGMTLVEAKAAIVDAQSRITIAANYDRTKEIGTAKVRLDDLYSRALRGRVIGEGDSKIVTKPDLRVAIQCQREMNRLLRLYDVPAPSPDASDVSPAAEELAQVKAHLGPLKLAGEAAPVSELARVAAEIVRRHKANGGQ